MHLVLVGGGHAHVQVLRRLAMEPQARTRLTLVVDTPVAVYSGMVPGFVAGQYRVEELQIDVRPLARRAGARVIVSPMTGLDAERRRILVLGESRTAGSGKAHLFSFRDQSYGSQRILTPTPAPRAARTEGSCLATYSSIEGADWRKSEPYQS